MFLPVAYDDVDAMVVVGIVDVGKEWTKRRGLHSTFQEPVDV